MAYKTLIPRYDVEAKKEYNQEHETPEKLNNLMLFAIGGNITDSFCTNWDIYADESGTLYSIARDPKTGCKNSYFGDVHHIRDLMRCGHWHDTLTTYGFNLMKATYRR